MKFRHLLLAGTAVCATGLLNAQIAAYSSDFEGLDPLDPNALAADGWWVGGNVFDSGNVLQYQYFPFPAPNGGQAFSAVDQFQGGPNQGLQQLSVYNDYNNADHGIGYWIEANVYREYTIDPGSVGTWDFTFDAKIGNITGLSTAGAFIKILDPNNGYSLDLFQLLDTTSIGGGAWVENQTISAPVGPGDVGKIFQIGFLNTATLFEGAGVFYDNVSLSPVPEPSTFALAGGLAALGFVLFRRRARADG